MPPASPPAYRLLLLLPDGSRKAPLAPGESILGSAGDCDIVLPHLTVSRRHARFHLGAEGLSLEDLGSRNGTRIDGERVLDARPVPAGAELEFGGVRARLEGIDADDLAPVLPPPDLPLAGRRETVTSLAVGPPTLGGAALEELLLRHLPALLEQALSGAGALEVGQALGREVYRAFPCRRLEILDARDATLVFQARERTDAASEGGDLDLDLESGGYRWRASFATPALGRALEPLARMGLSLLNAAERAARWGRDGAAEPKGRAVMIAGREGHGEGGGRGASGLKDGGGAARSGGPVSLHHRTLDRDLQAILAQVERVARGDIGVLIRGESGTGKEVLARWVHDLSPFAKAPFVAINCASLPRDLLEAELFGIERAVATGVEARPGKFESAHSGTLFLDEIGDMALETQAKILRVLQEGEVFRLGGQSPRAARPRIVAATNRDLDAMLDRDTFRRDLYYRIAGFVVRLPALRDRSLDIPNLAATFLAQAGERHGLSLPGLSVRAADLLSRYPWPGNIRELKHEIERAALFLQDGELLEGTALDARLRRPATANDSLKNRLDAFERNEIVKALEETKGDVPRAAEALGIGRSTLYRRMQVLGIAEPAE